MATRQIAVPDTPNRKISLDTWAVLIALAAAALIRFGLIPSIPW